MHNTAPSVAESLDEFAAAVEPTTGGFTRIALQLDDISLFLRGAGVAEGGGAILLPDVAEWIAGPGRAAFADRLALLGERADSMTRAATALRRLLDGQGQPKPKPKFPKLTPAARRTRAKKRGR